MRLGLAVVTGIMIYFYVLVSESARRAEVGDERVMAIVVGRVHIVVEYQLRVLSVYGVGLVRRVRIQLNLFGSHNLRPYFDLVQTA